MITPNDSSHTYFSIAYAGGARRLSLSTTPLTTEEGEAFGVKIEAPKSPVGDHRTPGLVQHMLPNKLSGRLLIALLVVVMMCLGVNFLFLDGTAGSVLSEFLPALAHGGEAIVVLDLNSAFTLKASLPSPIALPCTSAA